MAFGTFKTFGQMKDEDKYLRFFTKRNIIWSFIGIVIDCGILQIAKATGTVTFGIVLSAVVFVFFAGISFVKMPVSRYMSGGGLFLTTILMKLLMRRFGSNRALYTKYHREEGSLWG